MSVNYYWDEDRGVKTNWRQECYSEFERVTNNVHHGQYQDLIDHIKKWRDHPSNVWIEDGGYHLHYDADMTDDECYGLSVAFLQSILENRIRTLKRLANLYRKHPLEHMTAEDRYDFVRPKLGWMHGATQHTQQHLVEYPRHLLHVQRFKKTKQWNSST